MRFKFKLCCGYYIHKKKLELGQSTRIGHEVIGSNFVVPEKENKKVRTRPKKRRKVFLCERVLLCICVHIYLVRNSEMGLEQRIGEVSPLAMRLISGWMSS